jgi:predicted MFS family arabinose efflux permease
MSVGAQSVVVTAVSSRPTLAAILFMFAYLVSFLDRQILVLMIEPIQRDLNLTDTSFSLLHGTAFAFFYTIVGLFMGRIVDNHSRIRVIGWSIALWSLATTFCGLARNFATLFVARMAVGIGEAGLTPGVFSAMSDLFRPKERARAFGIYAMGIYFGTGAAFLVGGKLVEWLERVPPLEVPLLGSLFSWQLAFFIVSLPGLVLALAIVLLIPEPVRGSMDSSGKADAGNAQRAGVADFAQHYRHCWRPYVGHNLGFGLHMLSAYALISWVPVIFLRNHSWGIGEIGLAMGCLLITCGPIGALLGGVLARYLTGKGMQASDVKLGALACLGLGATGLWAARAVTPELALIGVGGAIFFMALPGGLNASSLQVITPVQYRGQAGALFLLIGNVLGLGIGPLAVALMTDYGFADQQSVGQSLQVVLILALPTAALLLWRVRHYFHLEAAS